MSFWHKLWNLLTSEDLRKEVDRREQQLLAAAQSNSATPELKEQATMYFAGKGTDRAGKKKESVK